MVTNTPVGVLAAIVILPSCLDFTVVHRLLGQTSTCRDHGRNELYDPQIVPGLRATRKLYPGRTLNDAGQKSACETCGAGEGGLPADLREAHFWGVMLEFH